MATIGLFGFGRRLGVRYGRRRTDISGKGAPLIGPLKFTGLLVDLRHLVEVANDELAGLLPGIR